SSLWPLIPWPADSAFAKGSCSRRQHSPDSAAQAVKAGAGLYSVQTGLGGGPSKSKAPVRSCPPCTAPRLRVEVEPLFDQFQNGRRIVGEGRDKHRGHAHARSPLIDHRRRHVIPIATVLIEGDDDDRLRPDRALLNQTLALAVTRIMSSRAVMTGEEPYRRP